MSLNSVTTLAQLQALLNEGARVRPAMVMVGSATCQPCQGLHPSVERLATQHPQADFHYFNVDLFEDHPQEPELTALFQALSLQFLPSHILLPVAEQPIVVCASQIESLTRALTQHHILNECPLPCPSS